MLSCRKVIFAKPFRKAVRRTCLRALPPYNIIISIIRIVKQDFCALLYHKTAEKSMVFPQKSGRKADFFKEKKKTKKEAGRFRKKKTKILVNAKVNAEGNFLGRMFGCSENFAKFGLESSFEEPGFGFPKPINLVISVDFCSINYTKSSFCIIRSMAQDLAEMVLFFLFFYFPFLTCSLPVLF